MAETTHLKTTGIGVIVLAAGASRRMPNRAKQLLIYKNQTLLRRAVETALASKAAKVTVVLGASSAETSAEIEDLPVSVVLNRDYETGLSSSLVCGLNALLADSEHFRTDAETVRAVVVTLADQPFVTAAHINRLIEVFERDNVPLVAAEYNSTVGVPALFSKTLFAELARIKGDKGAKELIIKHLASAAVLPMPSAATDIDTPADFARLSRQID